MEKIVIWGARNPIKSRALLILVQFMSLLTAMVLGAQLFIIDVELAAWMIYPLFGIFCTAMLLYPYRDRSSGNLFSIDFKKRRRYDFILALSCVLAVCVSFNQFLFAPENLNVSPTSSATSLLIVNKGDF